MIDILDEVQYFSMVLLVQLLYVVVKISNPTNNL